jgi:U3 small nucleolar RNA-associated protein 4
VDSAVIACPIYLFLFQYDFARLAVKNIRDSYGGAAWCLASSARDSLLVVGCEDGAARLFSYEDRSLEYRKSLPTTGSRVLSVAFHPKQPHVYLGCADGTIRCVEEVNCVRREIPRHCAQRNYVCFRRLARAYSV